MTVNKKLSTAEVQAVVEHAFANADGARLETKLPARTDDPAIGELASLDALEYERQRETAAADLGIRVTALDKLVKGSRASADDENAALPHWRVEPWPHPVDGAALLDSLRAIFRRYIVLPKGADIALPLWALHAWTMDTSDISPFIVLVSPTKRCGKTSVMIVLQYLTPRSELASNITASALFRYIEEVKPTLLIDEADSFAKDNEELRGILNSGHTKVAAYVIRNVEVNGEHRPRRFSTWAPKAIATIRSLADTLEDRAIIVKLQRKPPGAEVERLRRRDNDDFAALRSRAARWAADNFDRLVDPDPQMPKTLNDRAADNWRPLLAIADLSGGRWPEEARRAALTLSGEEDDGAVNVELLRDIRAAFGDDEVIRSADLLAKLTADPERPWAEWKHGRSLTQKQLAGLLRPFQILSLTVHPPGRADGKGYRRADFEQAWRAYCSGQNDPSQQSGPCETSIRPNADEMGTTRDFRNVRKDNPDGLKNGNLSHSHTGLDAWTDRNDPDGVKGQFDQEIGPPTDPLDDGFSDSLRRCAHCGRSGVLGQVALPDRPSTVWLHRACEAPWAVNAAGSSVTVDNQVSE
jgi:putative DNA primase/helicase